MNETKPQTFTDEFVECFARDEDCVGIMAKMVSWGTLLEGVDEQDSRVLEVIERCRRVPNTGGFTGD